MANTGKAKNTAAGLTDITYGASGKKNLSAQTEPETVQTGILPTAVPVNSYANLYDAYEQAMNNRANAYNTLSNAEANDAARQLQIVGNQGKSSLYGTQGLRGQGVSETSLLQNQMATGTTQGSVRSAYDSAMREVAMEKDQNLADTNRALGNQQVSYENSLQDLMTQYNRDVDDLESSIEHNANLNKINVEAAVREAEKEMYTNNASVEEMIKAYNAAESDAEKATIFSRMSASKSIKAYNTAIKKLKKDGDATNDWKIAYLREQRDALQAVVDEQKLANAKNSFSKTLSKYKSTTQIDKAIAAILSDGDTSNDWKLTYLNKYRTILNRKEVAARKAAKAAKKKKTKSDSDSSSDSGTSTTKLNQKARAKAKSDLKGNIATDVTNVWNPYYFLAGVNKK